MFEILIILPLLGVQNIVKELAIIIITNIDMISVKIDLLLDSNLTLLTLYYNNYHIFLKNFHGDIIDISF